jgi:hypothetical protein
MAYEDGEYMGFDTFVSRRLAMMNWLQRQGFSIGLIDAVMRHSSPSFDLVKRKVDGGMPPPVVEALLYHPEDTDDEEWD